jgi:hypothetical protein
MLLPRKSRGDPDEYDKDSSSYEERRDQRRENK